MSTLVLHLIGPLSTLPGGLLGGFAALADKPPSEDEIGTGFAYLVVFVLLVLAVAFLGFSLNKQLRKTRANAEAGVFGKDDDKR